MVRLPAVLTILNDADSRPNGPNWDIVARDLRRGGLLSEGKRGLGSAAVTLTDAANLLIAGMATSSPSKGPEVVQLYREMRTGPVQGQPWPHALALLPELPNFGLALEELIRTAPDLEGRGWRLQLVLRSPVPEAQLKMFIWGDGGLVETAKMSWHRGSFPIGPLTGDLQVITQAVLTERTIIAISRSING